MRLRDEDLKIPETKIVLIGNKLDLISFAESCPYIGSNSEECLTPDNGIELTYFYHRVKIDKECFQLWHLDQERLCDQEFFERAINGAKGFIYFNLTAKQLMQVERQRDAQTCIAIDFFATNLELIDWLKAFKRLYLRHPQLVDLYHQTIQKAWLVKESQDSAGSVFSFFPTDVIKHINQQMLALSPLVSINSKLIYVRLPLEQQDQNVLAAEKKPQVEIVEVDENCCSCSLI